MNRLLVAALTAYISVIAIKRSLRLPSSRLNLFRYRNSFKSVQRFGCESVTDTRITFEFIMLMWKYIKEYTQRPVKLLLFSSYTGYFETHLSAVSRGLATKYRKSFNFAHQIDHLYAIPHLLTIFLQNVATANVLVL